MQARAQVTHETNIDAALRYITGAQEGSVDRETSFVRVPGGLNLRDIHSHTGSVARHSATTSPDPDNNDGSRILKFARFTRFWHSVL